MKHSRKTLIFISPPASWPRWRRLTQIAFILSLALAAGRTLMPESIRAPIDALAEARPARQAATGHDDALLTQAPRSPGPATGVVLDLLFCLPALLILVRRVFDKDYRLLHARSLVPMALLALLVILSPLWATDQFASIVSASHFFAAMVFLWSTFQLVRSWLRLRIVAGVLIGLLIALSYVGYSYHLLENRDLRQMWAEKKAEISAEHGWTPDSYQAQMFEKRILNAQPPGFSTSTNTYAALLVLMGVTCAGVLIQRVADKDHWGWIILPALVLCAIPILILWTACRAAYVTPIIAAMILLAVWVIRRVLTIGLKTGNPQHPSEPARIGPNDATTGLNGPAFRPGQDGPATTSFHRPGEIPATSTYRKLLRIWHAGYCLALALIAAGVGVIVHRGLHHGNLWQNSLTFRWRYWTGAYRILTDGLNHYPRQWFNFLFGIGWENFGPYYLIHRLPIAPEEIRDPHNFIIRVFVELGMAGGILLLAWMLRLWWELTRPVLPIPHVSHPEKKDKRGAAAGYGQMTALLTIGGVSLLAIVINMLASVDFGSQTDAVIFEIFRRAIFLVMLVVGLLAASIRVAEPSAADRQAGNMRLELDERPAPWLLYAILAAVATFLIHNLIEFSLFEPAPIFLFCLMAGSALGLRTEGRREAREAPISSHESRTGPIIVVALAGIGWIAAAAAIAGPILLAESLAQDADDDTTRSIESHDRHLAVKAADEMARAFHAVPYNSDYARRASDLVLVSGNDSETRREARKLLDAAIVADPSSVQALIRRAQLELPESSQTNAAFADFRRALAQDPNNVRMRLDFARELLRVATSRNDRALAGDAAYEIERALDFNAQLPDVEVKRLTPREVADAEGARAKAEKLSRPVSSPRQ